MTDTITLRRLAARATPGPWVKGKTTHHTVTDKGYHIAEWHHADDAALMDALYPQKVIDLLNEIDSLRAALAQQAEQGWQPIETAPKSNPMKPEHRLIFWLDGVGPAFGYAYDDGAGGLLAVIAGYSGGRWEPTHWQAMLAAPKGVI